MLTSLCHHINYEARGRTIVLLQDLQHHSIYIQQHRVSEYTVNVQPVYSPRTVDMLSMCSQYIVNTCSAQGTSLTRIDIPLKSVAVDRGFISVKIFKLSLGCKFRKMIQSLLNLQSIYSHYAVNVRSIQSQDIVNTQSVNMQSVHSQQAVNTQSIGSD